MNSSDHSGRSDGLSVIESPGVAKVVALQLHLGLHIHVLQRVPEQSEHVGITTNASKPQQLVNALANNDPTWRTT